METVETDVCSENIAVMDEVDVGGKCVSMKQVGSSMLSS